MVFKFSHQNIREYCQKYQKINEYQITKLKKYARFMLKSCFGDILDRKTALFPCSHMFARILNRLQSIIVVKIFGFYHEW